MVVNFPEKKCYITLEWPLSESIEKVFQDNNYVLRMTHHIYDISNEIRFYDLLWGIPHHCPCNVMRLSALYTLV